MLTPQGHPSRAGTREGSAREDRRRALVRSPAFPRRPTFTACMGRPPPLDGMAVTPWRPTYDGWRTGETGAEGRDRRRGRPGRQLFESPRSRVDGRALKARRAPVEACPNARPGREGLPCRPRWTVLHAIDSLEPTRAGCPSTRGSPSSCGSSIVRRAQAFRPSRPRRRIRRTDGLRHRPGRSRCYSRGTNLARVLIVASNDALGLRVGHFPRRPRVRRRFPEDDKCGQRPADD